MRRICFSGGHFMNCRVFFTILFLTCTNFCFAEVSSHRPVILVPGWGPHWLTSMSDLRKFYEADGFPASQLHEVSYPYKEDPETIRRALSSQFQQIFSKYPKETKFDVVAHSLGGFAALYSLLKSGFANRFQKYISLAGVAHGQTKDMLIKRSKTHDYIIPAYNDFVMDFYALYTGELARIEKCALWSLDDKLVTAPHDSGAFEGGTNIELSGYSHLDFIHKRSIYEIMKTNCYDLSHGS